MTLYEFDIADLAKPVETKKRKSKKEITPAEDSNEGLLTTGPPNTKRKIEIDPPRPGKPNWTAIEPPAKKPRTEKQIAALEKAKETRRLKKEQIENEKKAIQDAIADKEAELQAKQEALALKKEAQKEKRKLAREAKNSASETSLDREVNVEVAKVVPKIKNKSIAPPWFTEHLTAKEIRKQARNSQLQEIAKQPWKELGKTEQDRARTLNNMYNSMFGPNR